MAETNSTLEFRVLGSVEAHLGPRQLDLGGPKQRSLMALLLIEQGRPVAADRLADQLWDGNPPDGAATTLRSYVSRLRTALGSETVIGTPAGYALDAAADSVDAHKFEELTGQGESALRRGAPGAAAERLHAALALWSGPAFAGISDVAPLTLEARRLEELRLVCLEQRIEADLDLGRHGEVVAELKRLVEEEPLRERLWRHLVLALYRCDRQADALDAYRRARERLRDELGLEPGEDLRELERAILHHDLPAVAASVARHNLPAPVSGLVGRERELEEIPDLLRKHRLVVLNGVGGSGKTRLALEIARQQVGAWADGVRLTDLTPLADPALVPDAVATALDSGGGDTHGENLVERTGESELLLVLDNCEHLVDASAELVTALLHGCPNVRVLATSRVPLHVQGEVSFEVDPLPTPAESASPDEIEDAPAVRLFWDRATAVRPGLGATPEHLETAARISRELDGLPLAIELAAARAKALSLEQIATRLGDRFRFLSSWRGIIDPRHRTLEAAMDWSYELLTEHERELFCGLAVFAGRFTAADAAGVCLEGDEPRSLELIARLVDASLVRAEDEPEPGGGMRYRLLETVREYATKRLVETNTEPQLRRAHAEYFLRRAESAQLSTEAGGEQRFEAVLFEQDNIRAAFDWALENDPLLAAGLAISLEQFWVSTRPFEGMRWFEALHGHAVQLPPELRARMLLAHGGMTFMAGDFERGEQLYESALRGFRELGEEARAAEVLHRLAMARLQADAPDEARALTTEALGIQRRLGDRRGEAVALGTLGSIAHHEGDHERAAELLEQSAGLAAETGFFWWRAHTLYELGEIAVEGGSFELAEEQLRSALEQATGIGERQLTIYTLALLARTAAERGAVERAGVLWGAVEAEEQREPVGQWEADRDEYAAPILANEGPAFARGREEGRSLALADAVEVALQKA